MNLLSSDPRRPYAAQGGAKNSRYPSARPPEAFVLFLRIAIYARCRDPLRGRKAYLCLRPATVTRAAARSAVYKGGSLLGLTVVRVFAGYAVFL